MTATRRLAHPATREGIDQMSTGDLGRLNIAENADGSLASVTLLRWALVIIFLWFGGMKFTAYEANGIAPFIANGPFMSWLHAVFGIQRCELCHRHCRTFDRRGADHRRLQRFFFCVGGGDVHGDLCHHPDLLREHARCRRANGGRLPGDLCSARTVPVEGSGAACRLGLPACGIGPTPSSRTATM